MHMFLPYEEGVLLLYELESKPSTYLKRDYFAKVTAVKTCDPQAPSAIRRWWSTIPFSYATGHSLPCTLCWKGPPESPSPIPHFAGNYIIIQCQKPSFSETDGVYMSSVNSQTVRSLFSAWEMLFFFWWKVGILLLQRNFEFRYTHRTWVLLGW